MADVFVSYDHRDERAAFFLEQALQARGWATWRAHTSLDRGAYAQAIAEEIASCRLLIVLWTPASTGSLWVRAEVERALALDKPVVQCRIGPCELPLPFNAMQFVAVEAVEIQGARAFDRALEAAEATLGPPSGTPVGREARLPPPVVVNPPEDPLARRIAEEAVHGPLRLREDTSRWALRTMTSGAALLIGGGFGLGGTLLADPADRMGGLVCPFVSGAAFVGWLAMQVIRQTGLGVGTAAGVLRVAGAFLLGFFGAALLGRALAG